MASPLRGEIWYADFDPTVGHEQSGIRPALIVSDDRFNKGRGRMVFAAPLTSSFRNVVWQIEILPPEAGMKQRSFILCDQIRAMSADRFQSYIGNSSAKTLAEVEDRLRVLLGL